MGRARMCGMLPIVLKKPALSLDLRRGGSMLSWLVWTFVSACGERSSAPDAGAIGSSHPSPPSVSSGLDRDASNETTPTREPTNEAMSTSRPITLIAGGDIDLARSLGKRLLRDPSFDPFIAIHGWMSQADVRFANLESTLSEQRGETESPVNNLVFTAPPVGADVLKRAGFDVVSTANNHAWDYGERALNETIANLDRVGIAHAGTGPNLDAARAPAIVATHGRTIAFFAATAVWNHGALAEHPARDHVARADRDALIEAVKKQRATLDADVIVVSVHGGEEYRESPHTPMRELARALIDAGADAVIAHHPHVPQGIEMHAERPIFYSLGNLRMSMHSDHPETGLGLLAKIVFPRGRAPITAVCPFRTVGPSPVPIREMTGDRAALERATMTKLRGLNASLGATGAKLSELGADGCARVLER